MHLTGSFLWKTLNSSGTLLVLQKAFQALWHLILPLLRYVMSVALHYSNTGEAANRHAPVWKLMYLQMVHWAIVMYSKDPSLNGIGLLY